MEKRQGIESKFWQFALPSMLSQLLNSLFIIVDGFYVGQNLGDVGLAAINVAWPMVALIQAISMAIGTGGAVWLAMDLGRQDLQSALKSRAHAIAMLVVTAVVMGLGYMVSYPYILPLLGANEELYPLTEEYIRVVCIFAICQVFTTGLLPLLRGAGRTMAAMSLTILGLVGNIWLDWLFIHHYHWGMGGAALATALSQGVSAFLALLLLLVHKGMPLKLSQFRPERRRILGICYYGCSAFGLTISTSILILLTNLRALHYGGTEGVAVYAILSYVLGSVLPLVSGVGEGIQPLLSRAYGAYDWKAIGRLRRSGLALAVGTAMVCSGACWYFRAQLPAVFGASPWAAEEGTKAMWTLVLAFPFMAAVRFLCSYFCSLGMAGASSILSYGEPLVMQPLFLYLLPLIMGLTGVWVSYPAAMVAMTVLAWGLLMGHRKKHPHPIS